ncbi:GvpL/GvpF family gas vesicle protein [Leptolyngbya sp. NK1-12]|uniref:GvpL/GvpF family gas vesicle protein n=1 Tax=Leptolyngbya sp. NK1-12 TaxID=2547451 RepID=A0AA97AGB0_9CYAN|nr:GvpL/GvpF family gas vesicle protein [Leptolyngbya sp. NK1-12]WNZ23279.1 GvpL/GvpF family gas vesicle protein [Leptolyngbya sp. NK1-12]
MSSLYLYGILPASSVQLAAEGLDHQPVQTHEMHGFTFLYSHAQQDRYLASRRNLLGHERVLEQAMEQGYRALLPLQFGMTINDWATVEQQLILPQGEKLKHLFVKLEGRREVGVKVFWDAEQELAALMASDADLRAKRDQLVGKPLGMDQVVQIGQAIEQAMQERKQQVIATFQSELNSLAVEVVENEALTESMIYNAAYLIEWEAEAQFGQQVEALDQQFEGRLRIRYNNFTAPFNFAQLN